MSIPSSSASVVMTASRSPFVSLPPARGAAGGCSRRGRARPVGERRGSLVAVELEPREPGDELDRLARLDEADRPRAAGAPARRRSSAASASALARIRSASSTTGGFHIAIWRRAPGEPSRSTSATSSKPVSRSASSTGLAIVALASRNRGSVPYAPATRRSRRSTLATCAPNTPRYTCASSTTTTARFAKKSPHAPWLGRIPTWSMSGFVRMRFARRRIAERSSRRVSPS